MTEQTKPAGCPAEIPDHRPYRGVIMEIRDWLDPHPPAKPNPQAALDCAEQWLIDNPVTTMNRKYPKDPPKWKPFLRGYFFVRKYFRGWCICWHAWNAHQGWGVTWGIGFQNLQEAKAVRRFLNRRVSRGGSYGATMAEAVAFIQAGNGPRHSEWGDWRY